MLQSDLDKEFSVVRNEFEIGENDPGSILNERILSTAYLWHNYGSSTIGSKEDIERVKADRLKRFYQKYYQPDNATLIVAGKFDEKKVLAQIGEYFAPIPRPSRVLEKTYTVEPAQDGQRSVELRRAGDTQLVAAVYHTAALADKDAAPLDALSEILTSNPSGYLYKALIDSHIGSSVYSYQSGFRDPGFMGAQNWEDFINDVKDCFGNKMYNIAELIQKNIFFENNGAPLAFFDDFSDLKCFHSKFSDVPFNISVKDIVEGLSSLGY